MWQNIINFFSSNFITVLLTNFLTIFGAVYAYRLQKRHEKQQIARLLVNQIRNAEISIQKLVEYTNTEEYEFPSISVLPQNGWHEYAHLFTTDFNQDDTEHINSFFNIAVDVEHIVRNGNRVDRFLNQISQRSEAIQNEIMNVLSSSKKENVKSNFDDFIDKLDHGRYHYKPAGFQSHFKELLKNYRPVLESHAGTVLKKVAKLQV